MTLVRNPQVIKLLQGEQDDPGLPQTDFTTTQAGAESSAIRTKQGIERNQDFSQFPWGIQLSLLKTKTKTKIQMKQNRIQLNGHKLEKLSFQTIIFVIF